jgi:hypothetical protein
MSISYGQLITCSLELAGDTDLFRFSGNAGEAVLIQITFQSGSLRPCIELIAPDNSKIIACANAFSNRIDTTLNQSGNYTILVDVLIAGSTGNYSLALERLIAPSPNAAIVQFGELYQGSIDLEGDVDLFTFSGEENTSIRIQGTYVTGSLRPCIELIAPNNSRISACNNAFSN